ncbi:hypothetical protein FLAPXU55_02127 [Flavobacterium panici]|uniref:Uncharacterized protein n=1 Tax=Flavobacterium panici TaxID=2654843 RepID=A0A9N8P1V4_9FLAO|nr:hypothetical protein FLAPXU55_02127 [Flavobacterium panici]
MSFNLKNYNLKLNTNDIKFVLSAAKELSFNGFTHVAFPVQCM